MRHLGRHLSSLRRKLYSIQKHKLTAVAFVIGLAVVGASLLFISQAATPSVSFEAEDGQKTSNIESLYDTSASGGKAIKFGPTFTLDPSFDKPSKSDPTDYRMHVDFNVVCLAGTSKPIARIAPDDPIVFPGQPGAAHMHVFTGNTSVDAYSTQGSLEAGSTNCLLDRDTATYWMPQLYAENGSAVLPYHARAYYRAGTLNQVSYIPRGLKIIAGDAKATTPQNKGIAGWQCRTVSPDEVAIAKQATIPTCASTDLLEASVVFPNCWDGVNLDSADHKSHMSYSNADGKPDDCDTAHPVIIPQLTVAYRYKPGTTNSNAYLSSGNSGLTLHADFWNAWHQPTLDALVDRCINDGVHCGDVSPSHFPGPIPQK